MIIQTTIPIPGNKKKIYFEVSIRHDGNDGGIIDIGLSKRMMFSQESSGLNQHSYVYISDGTIEYGKMKQENTKKYGQEDVVGCYADLEKQIFYFTKNGLVVNEPIGYNYSDILSPPQLLYPTIVLSAEGSRVQTNFGEKRFMFNVKGKLIYFIFP